MIFIDIYTFLYTEFNYTQIEMPRRVGGITLCQGTTFLPVIYFEKYIQNGLVSHRNHFQVSKTKHYVKKQFQIVSMIQVLHFHAIVGTMTTKKPLLEF